MDLPSTDFRLWLPLKHAPTVVHCLELWCGDFD